MLMMAVYLKREIGLFKTVNRVKDHWAVCMLRSSLKVERVALYGKICGENQWVVTNRAMMISVGYVFYDAVDQLYGEGMPNVAFRDVALQV